MIQGRPDPSFSARISSLVARAHVHRRGIHVVPQHVHTEKIRSACARAENALAFWRCEGNPLYEVKFRATGLVAAVPVADVLSLCEIQHDH